MPDDITQLKQEVAHLRRELDHVLRMLGQEENQADQTRPEFLLLDAEILSLRHRKDRMPLVLKAQEGGAAIYLNDSQGRARGVFQIDEEGSARFEIWNKDQQVVVSIGETPDGSGEIYIASPDGRPRAGMKASEIGGIVSTQGAKGRVGALVVGKDSGGAIVIADSEGRPVAEVSTSNQQGMIAVKRAGGETMAYLGCDGKRGLVVVSGENAKEAARLASDDHGGTLAFNDDYGGVKAVLPGKKIWDR